MNRISVILATFNEEKNIKDCLELVRGLADEIVIVDGSSTDRTVEIAKKFGARVIVKDNPVMFHQNKQLAIEKATGDWILYLDADERVTPKLAKVIKNAINKAARAVNGFWFPRKNIIFGKWMRHTGWWPDYQLRLFRRGKGYLPCKTVHEQPEVSGKTKYLRTPLVHYNYQTVFQFIDKLNRLYTENDKNCFLAGGKEIKWTDAIRWPVEEFFRRYFQQKGYKDGLHGLVLSLFQAFSALVTFAKIWEKQNFREYKNAGSLALVEKEFKKLIKDGRYWFSTVFLSESTDFVKKIYLKLRRKLGQ